jgi:hypothetical protein
MLGDKLASVDPVQFGQHDHPFIWNGNKIEKSQTDKCWMQRIRITVALTENEQSHSSYKKSQQDKIRT